MTKRSSTFGGILIFIGAYLSGTGLMGTIYLMQHGAAHKAGTFVSIMIGGLIAVALGYFLRSQAFSTLAPTPPPPKQGSLTLGDWMRSQSIANAPPLPQSASAPAPAIPATAPASSRLLSTNSILTLVGLSVSLLPYLLTLVFRPLNFIMSLLPQSHGRLTMLWVMPSLFGLFVFWAFKRGIHNAGLRWDAATDRRYMAAYTLRALLAFGVFWGVSLLPWGLLALSHPDEGTMMLIGWSGLLWMPIVMGIAAFIATRVFRVWTITRD